MSLMKNSSLLEKRILNGSGPLTQSFAERVAQSPFTAAALGGAICGAGYQLLTRDRSDPNFYDRMLQRTIGGAIFVVGIYSLSPEFLRGTALLDSLLFHFFLTLRRPEGYPVSSINSHKNCLRNLALQLCWIERI
jgi:hypothetical protein